VIAAGTKGAFMKTLRLLLHRVIAPAVGLISLAVVAPSIRADSWAFGLTPIPNWALGSPQPAAIGFCSNIDPFATCGAGVSDSLAIGLLTGGVTARASTEVPGPVGAVFPLIWPGNTGPGIINITIPFANWVFPGWPIWADNPRVELGFASDALVFWNFGATANATMISVDPFGIDPPSLDDSLLLAGLDAALPYLPPQYAIADNILHTMTPVDISSSVDPSTGAGMLPPGDEPNMASEPEPSSFALFVTVIAATAGLVIRQRWNREA